LKRAYPRASSADLARLSERNERSECSELCASPEARAAQGSRPARADPGTMSPAAARTAGPYEGEQEGCFVPNLVDRDRDRDRDQDQDQDQDCVLSSVLAARAVDMGLVRMRRWRGADGNTDGLAVGSMATAAAVNMAVFVRMIVMVVPGMRGRIDAAQ
jgi:hypothetical protein